MADRGTPEMQAILALCHHPKFEHGCAACDFRRAAAVEHLVDLIDHLLADLPGSRR